LLCGWPGLARDDTADRNGAASLASVSIGPIGSENVDNEFVELVIEIENLHGHTLTVVKLEAGDRKEFDLVQPLREFRIRHFIDQHSMEKSEFFEPLASKTSSIYAKSTIRSKPPRTSFGHRNTNSPTAFPRYR
jgi:hypothetical protein